mmetsp:Transcript_75161/g.168704  ORF Transcript_75161/g.168704 Transcript_75161/m.168704 type:complete len:102 (+) Transcript_75161:2-307(+)
MGNAYGFNTSQDAEVLLRWCQLLIRHNCQDDIPVIERFFEAHGGERSAVAAWRALVDKCQLVIRWKFHTQHIWKLVEPQMADELREEVRELLDQGKCLGPF